MRGDAPRVHSLRVGETQPTEYLAECLWTGVGEGDVADLDARVRAEADGDVRYLGSMLLPKDDVVFFVFAGPSAEAVRTVAERAEIPFERIVESVRVSWQTKRGEQ